MIRILVVPTDPHLRPALLADAVARVSRERGDAPAIVEVLIPAVLPSTLPISACPPRIAARLAALRDAAGGCLSSLPATGRVEVVPCRSVPALLHAADPPERLVLVGRAGWRIRRAAQGVCSDVSVIAPSRQSHRQVQPAPLRTRREGLAE